MATIHNEGNYPGGDDIGLTRTLREFTRFIQGLEPSDLTPTDRAALRTLLDDLEALRDTAYRRQA